MKDLTVLISACGAQFSPGLINCLKENGERNIRIIGVDINPEPTAKQMVDELYKTPAATDPAYVDELLEISKKEHVDVILPVMSAELLPLIDRKDEFESFGTKVSVPDRKSVEITTNKYRFYEFLKENDLPVPKFSLIKKAEDLLSACEECGYPESAVCVKATGLSGSRGVRIIKPGISRLDILFHEKPNSYYTTMDDLLSILKERKEIPEMMAMEFLPGMEGSVDLIADNGKTLYSAYRESTVNLHSIPQVGEVKYNPKACRIAKDVVCALSFTGNADFDFKNDANGNPVLMEVNPRVAATMRIFKEAGMNLPYLRIKHLLGEELPDVQIRYGVKMVRRYQEMFC